VPPQSAIPDSSTVACPPKRICYCPRRYGTPAATRDRGSVASLLTRAAASANVLVSLPICASVVGPAAAGVTKDPLAAQALRAASLDDLWLAARGYSLPCIVRSYHVLDTLPAVNLRKAGALYPHQPVHREQARRLRSSSLFRIVKSYVFSISFTLWCRIERIRCLNNQMVFTVTMFRTGFRPKENWPPCLTCRNPETLTP
jgi:hypothetical protein